MIKRKNKNKLNLKKKLSLNLTKIRTKIIRTKNKRLLKQQFINIILFLLL